MPRLSKAIAILSIALLAAIVLKVAWHDRDMAVDDAYITFRYAANLQAGHGLRWNVDSPPCEGYSNLSYVVALAGLGALGVPPQLGALSLAAAGVVTIAVLLALALRGSGRWAGLVVAPAVLVFVPRDVSVHASRGLETVLFGALACLHLAAIGRVLTGASSGVAQGVAAGRRLAFAAAASGVVLFLTRPDGVLLSTVWWLAGWWLVRRDPARRRSLWLAVVTWLTTGGCYALVKLWWFGYLLPNPFYMKADVPGFAGTSEIAAFVGAYWLVLVLAAAAALAGPLRRRDVHGPGTEHDAVPILAAVAAVPWLAYGAKIVHEIGFAHRFAWPLVPVLALGAARGFAQWARGGGERVARAWPIGWLVTIVLVAPQWPALAAQFRHVHAPRPRDPCTAAFLRLGEAIATTGIAPELTLFCSHAGATPFAAGAHHVDPAGLVDDGFCRRTPEPQRAAYFAGLRFDVVAWNVFPASPGAATFDADARALASPYLASYWRAAADLDAGTRHGLLQQDEQTRKAGMFLHMAVLRDHATLVGEMDTGLPRARCFVYVWKQSRYHDRLVAHLAPRMDVAAAAIDYTAGTAGR